MSPLSGYLQRGTLPHGLLQQRQGPIMLFGLRMTALGGRSPCSFLKKKSATPR